MKHQLPSTSDSGSPASARPVRAGTLGALLVLTVVVLLPYTLTRQPAWLDEAIFSYMARGPSALGLPYYHVGLDNKPPGVFLLYQMIAAFDPVGLWRMRMLQGLLVLGACVVLLLWLRREVSPQAGWWAAFLYAFLMAFTPGCLALTEPPMAAFTVVGFCLAYYGLRPGGGRLLVGAGLAWGLAITFKQVAVFDLAAGLLVVGIAAGAGRRGAAVGAVLGGAALCAMGVGAALAATGQWPQFWEGAVVMLVEGTGAGSWATRLGNLPGYWRWILPVIQAPALTALLAYVARPPRPLGLMLGAWLIAGCLGVAASGHYLNHQSAQFFAPLAALSGVGGAWLLREGSCRSDWSARLALVLLTLLVFAVPVDKYRIRVQQELASRAQVGRSGAEQLGTWLRAGVPGEETIYVLGNGMPVYFYARRFAPTRYFHTLLLTRPERRRLALADLEARPPLALVFARDYYEGQREFSAQVRAALGSRYRRLLVHPGAPEYEVWWRTS